MGLGKGRTYVVKLYLNASGDTVCRVTDVVSGRRWVVAASQEVVSLFRAGCPESTSSFARKGPDAP